MATTFLYEQIFGTKSLVLPTTSLAGRTVLITGANTGLGLQSAIHLARLSPARLILACRNVPKGELAKSMIKEMTQFEAVEVWELDLASFENVKAFGKRCSELERLDSVVLNAGIANRRWEVTKDGHEQTIQVNDLSTGLLALLLLPLLSKSADIPLPTPAVAAFKPHLCIVGSEVHGFARFEESHAMGSTLTALNRKGLHVAADRYNVSKLLNIFICRQIAALPIASNLVVNVVNPGLCISELRRELTGPLAYLLDSFARTGAQGAMNIVWAAVEDTSATPGAYISCCSIKPPSPYCLSEVGKKMEVKVWGEMVELWKEVAPEVSVILSSGI